MVDSTQGRRIINIVDFGNSYFLGEQLEQLEIDAPDSHYFHPDLAAKEELEVVFSQPYYDVYAFARWIALYQENFEFVCLNYFFTELNEKDALKLMQGFLQEEKRLERSCLVIKEFCLAREEELPFLRHFVVDSEIELAQWLLEQTGVDEIDYSWLQRLQHHYEAIYLEFLSDWCLDKRNCFTVAVSTPAKLNTLLPVGFRDLHKALIAEVIAEVRVHCITSLKETLFDEWEPCQLLVELGKERAKALLARAPKFGDFVASMCLEEFNQLWSVCCERIEGVSDIVDGLDEANNMTCVESLVAGVQHDRALLPAWYWLDKSDVQAALSVKVVKRGVSATRFFSHRAAAYQENNESSIVCIIS